ncbi:MAG: N-acetylglucosamine-6-phosphate deacetylase [Chloroflexi bacterium]|nr:N-acetylglucosamine-6-phosphate deacetylase [Chloroflexota bacterium]
MRGISQATLITPTGVIENGSLVVDDNGRICKILPTPHPLLPPHTPILNAAGFTVAPGFIDLQLNGGFGHDFTADPGTIWNVAARLPQFGVTTFLPTIITAPWHTYQQAQDILANGPPAEFSGALPLGLHFEGPFLNPGKQGAHDSASLRQPDLTAVREWSPENGMRLVTLAPELPGAAAVIQALAERGILVSAGHSLATFTEARLGFDNGIRYGTHLFNAMSGIHHRQPGLAGALLSDDRVTIGLVPDGIHVHPALVKMAWQTAAQRLNLVSDAMAALGMPPGTYKLGDKQVNVRAESDAVCLTARLADGTLAGSVLSLDAAVRNLIQYTGCTLPEAVATVTHMPADLLNLETGKIQAGYAADFVLLDHNLDVAKTIVAGKIIYEAEEQS